MLLSEPSKCKSDGGRKKAGLSVDRDYDIFERFPDGTVVWRDFVNGLEAARAKLDLLGGRCANEFFAMYVPTKEITARVNFAQSPEA